MSLHQDTAPGSSIYKVQAVDKDMGSGGSVSYYLQVNVQLCVLEDALFSLAGVSLGFKIQDFVTIPVSLTTEWIIFLCPDSIFTAEKTFILTHCSIEAFFFLKKGSY